MAVATPEVEEEEKSKKMRIKRQALCQRRKVCTFRCADEL